MTTSLENWKLATKQVIDIAEKEHRKATIYPLDDYIIHTYKFVEALTRKKIDPSELKKILEEEQDLIKVLDEYKKALANLHETPS